MSWHPDQYGEFEGFLSELFGKQPKPVIVALGKVLQRFPLPAVKEALTQIAMTSERKSRPPLGAMLEALAAGGVRESRPAVCDYCDGARSFPIELVCMKVEQALAMGLTRNEVRRIAWTSTRTDLAPNEKHREVMALRVDLWGKYPGMTTSTVVNFWCHWCSPSTWNPAFTTRRLHVGKFWRLSPRHGHLAGDLKRVIEGKKVFRGKPVTAAEFARDEEAWDQLLQGAADEGDRERHDLLVKWRKALEAGAIVEELLAKETP